MTTGQDCPDESGQIVVHDLQPQADSGPMPSDPV